MNLFEKIRDIERKEVAAVTNIIKKYFNGYDVVVDNSNIDADLEMIGIDYNIEAIEDFDIDFKIEVNIYFNHEIEVAIYSLYEGIDGTNTGYLEQTIKRELTDKSLILSEE